jgi:apolipoprotein N-acyltransferase
VSRRRHSLNPAKAKVELAALNGPDGPAPAGGGFVRSALVALVLGIATSILLRLSFTPMDQWYFAYVALVPWGMAVVRAASRRRAALWSGVTGMLFWAIGVYWLTWITIEGYVAAVAYLSLYWVVAGLALRAAYRRGWPMFIALPVAWVALEYLRAFVIGGFSWFYLAHSQYQCIALIQITDITGQYGVSFFVAMVNGAALDAAIWALQRAGGGAHKQDAHATAPAWTTRRVCKAVGICGGVAGIMLGYGAFRLSQQTTSEGPVLGVTQMAFPLSLTHRGATSGAILADHIQMTRQGIGRGCDLLVWPESMLGYVDMNPADWENAGVPPPREGDLAPAQLAELEAFLDGQVGDVRGREIIELLKTDARWRVARWRMVVGRYTGAFSALQSLIADLGCPLLGGSTMPVDSGAHDRPEGYGNSALLLDRDKSGKLVQVERYDKMQLVPFSECVPFGESWPWLHQMLRRMVPDVMPQLIPGPRPVLFEVGHQGQAFHFAAPICFEGTFDRVCRELVMRDGRKRADLLINISNDGWFIYLNADGNRPSMELDEHLSQYVFRAIENRVPVVRAVNCGISADIDSNGRIRQVIEHGGDRKMVAGTMTVKTLVDQRTSLYSLAGNAFAALVSLAAAVGVVVLAWPRRWRRDKDV